MARVPAQVFTILTSATRPPIRPVLFSENLFRGKLPQCPSRQFSACNYRPQERDRTQDTEDDVSGHMEFASAKEGMSVADKMESNHDQPVATEIIPTHMESGMDWSEDAFKQWVNNVVALKPTFDIRKPVSFASGIYVRPLSLKAGSMCINVEFSEPGKANALGSGLLSRLTDAFKSIAQRKMIKGVCLTSGPHASGGPFCAGANVDEMSDLRTRSEAEVFIRKISNLCTAIRKVPVPVIALINGPCLGAGLEVAASCDIRVATTRATFSMPEVRVCLPSVIQARLLCDIIGWGRARHLMLTGCIWSAHQAAQAGLVTELFDTREDMMDWAHAYMARLNEDKTHVYRAQKRLMQVWEKCSIDEGIEAGVRCFANHFAHEGLGDDIRRAKARGDHKRKQTGSTEYRRLDIHNDDSASKA